MGFFLGPSLSVRYRIWLKNSMLRRPFTVENPDEQRETPDVGRGIVSSLDGRSPAGLIAWTEDGSIYTANLDGSNKREILPANSSNGAVTGLAYDNVTGTLYAYGRSDPNSVNDGYGFVEEYEPEWFKYTNSDRFWSPDAHIRLCGKRFLESNVPRRKHVNAVCKP